MPPAVADPLLAAITDTLVNRFAPERVVLFGSLARGEHRPESADALRNIWNKLKERLSREGSQSVTNCHRLKLPAADGKSYLTDVADAETLLRLVQSVPSPKAEPIKLWLAKGARSEGRPQCGRPSAYRASDSRKRSAAS